MEFCNLSVSYHFSFGSFDLFWYLAVSWMSCANQPLIIRIFWDSSSICAPPRTAKMALIVKNRLIVARNLRISRIQQWFQHITISTNWCQHESWRRWECSRRLGRGCQQQKCWCETDKSGGDEIVVRKRKWLMNEKQVHWNWSTQTCRHVRSVWTIYAYVLKLKARAINCQLIN